LLCCKRLISHELTRIDSNGYKMHDTGEEKGKSLFS
jgi:hypothetical protein